MQEPDKLSYGAFCWIELVAKDPSAWRDFYAPLFGWSLVEGRANEKESFTVFTLNDRRAGGVRRIRPEQTAMGLAPHWKVHVAVESAEGVAAKVAALGGTVLEPPGEGHHVTRTAAFRDPAGAIFSVWEHANGQGLSTHGEDRAFCWADLKTPNPEPAWRFYSSLFGWRMATGRHDACGDFHAHEALAGYYHIQNGDARIGGIPPLSQADRQTCPHWVIYFAVPDVDRVAANAVQLGATLHIAPRAIQNVGVISVIDDPEGARFGVFRSNMGR